MTTPRLTPAARARLGERLREALPGAHVVVGAPRYAFLEVIADVDSDTSPLVVIENGRTRHGEPQVLVEGWRRKPPPPGRCEARVYLGWLARATGSDWEDEVFGSVVAWFAAGCPDEWGWV